MTEPSAEAYTPPKPFLDITVGEETHKLFMAYAALNRVINIIGDNTEALAVAFNAENRSTVLAVVLKKRGKYGVLEKEEDLDELELTPVEANKIIQWVMEHYLDFFIGATETALALKPKAEKFMASLTPLVNGSGASAGTSLFVGRLADDPANLKSL